ncbi:uncharacterized protein NPIL_398881 [Nephila pilipes]|uniref:DUF5641 domain-containing protein n=1 Tax=Nephila pilipes TaxID=299642 RepID=A0A8X6UVB9_NEPPI|nr:uncharacterized protein NPIL_398881 [Nephila pilipes]
MLKRLVVVFYIREGHGVRTCSSKLNCQLCGKKHHLFLCRTLSLEPNSSSVHKNDEVREPMIQHNEVLANLSESPNVFLQTLTVLVEGENAKRKARAIIDSGSQRTYILKTTAEEIKNISKRREYVQYSLLGGINTSTYQHDVFTIYLSSVTRNVVLIGNDNQKRINCPLGRVVEIILGKEGITMLVRHRTARGETLKPIQRLFPPRDYLSNG